MRTLEIPFPESSEYTDLLVQQTGNDVFFWLELRLNGPQSKLLKGYFNIEQDHLETVSLLDVSGHARFNLADYPNLIAQILSWLE